MPASRWRKRTPAWLGNVEILLREALLEFPPCGLSVAESLVGEAAVEVGEGIGLPAQRFQRSIEIVQCAGRVVLLESIQSILVRRLPAPATRRLSSVAPKVRRRDASPNAGLASR